MIARNESEGRAKFKVDISRITAEASKRAKIKAEVSSRERADKAKRKTEEAGA